MTAPIRVPTPRDSHMDYAALGNGQVAALIDESANIAWMCLPRLDSDAVFNGLLGGEGVFRITLESLKTSEQHHIRNTAMLVTEMEDEAGAKIRITDFAPKFRAKGRDFRPVAFVRRVEVLKGSPRLRVELNPTFEYNSETHAPETGTSHLSWPGFRVSTNAPITHVEAGTPFVPFTDTAFILTPDESLSDEPTHIAREWEMETRDWWQNWVKSLAVPLDYQESVIRAAIGLRLCVFEDTGGVVAALTTSIPEHKGSERNWDYRYCWIRDAYFAVNALARLSDLGSRDAYGNWLMGVATAYAGKPIQPLFGIGLETKIEEWVADALPGFEGHAPVRVGNAAYTQVQNDVYGQIILGLVAHFFDARREHLFGETEFSLLEKIGETAVDKWSEPDAGIWEFRESQSVHTSSVMFCWAACDRLSKVADHLGLDDRQSYWRDHADTIREALLEHGYNETRKAFTARFDGDELDASLLLLNELGVLPADDERFVNTVERIDEELRSGNHVFRYVAKDDFGEPETAFTACTFWHIDALHRIGRTEDAREMFENLLSCRSRFGLLSEDIYCNDETLWGNYPQTYCLAGIIDCALRLSRPWHTVI